MHVVLVSSPGAGAEAHWSHAAAAALAARLVVRGGPVTWLQVPRPGQVLPAAPAAVATDVVAMARLPALRRVAHDTRHLAVEQRLTRALRGGEPAVVVHVGLGARGSPNVCWLADRLGATTFAVARAAEVVCHRGDLVDRGGAGCREFLSAGRCRTCCGGRVLAPSLDALRNRADLLAASLLVCRAVFVPDAADAARLAAFGASPRSLVAGLADDAIADRLTP